MDNKKIDFRERLIKFGAEQLQDAELIAVLIRTGTKDKNVFNMSLEILDLFQNLTKFKNVTIDDLKSIYGVSDAKACSIVAAIELGKRMNQVSKISKVSFNKASDIYDYLREDMEMLEQEHLIVLNMDIKGNVIKRETVYIGTTDRIVADIKDIYKSAVKLSAFGIILIHNHPSGDATPSHADYQLTERIKHAGTLLNVKMIEHLIMGKAEYYSFNHNRKFFL